MEPISSAHSKISGLGEQSALINFMPRFNTDFPIIYKNGDMQGYYMVPFFIKPGKFLN